MARLFSEIEYRHGPVESVLDWQTGLRVASSFPHVRVFSPLEGAARSGRLPYLDRTVDIVLVDGEDASRVAEARRVARECVVLVDRGKGKKRTRLEAIGTTNASSAPMSMTIIIPAFNRMSETIRCLLALQRTLPESFVGEVIVVDDASADETWEALNHFAKQWKLVRPVRNGRNRGFTETCNRGAGLAQGDILFFLNQDTEPLPGWLPPLLAPFADESVGAVGSMLVFPNGVLQEAGGVVFDDGSCANFGRGLDPTDPLTTFVREVDYCSAAALAVRRRVFEAIGGFDLRYRPAYYEDTDLCVGIWAAGQRVMFQPASVVIHHEGSVHGTDPTSGGKRHQATHQATFAEKWTDWLTARPPRPRAFDLETWYDLAVRRPEIVDA